MVTRTLVAILAGCLSVAAASAADRTAPRALGAPPESTDNCYRIHGRSGEVAGEAKVSVSVAADGRVTGATSAPGTPPSLAAAAQCVAVAMKFEPALEGGTPVAGQAVVDVAFPTLPRLRQDLERAVEYCQPAIQPLVKLNNASFEGALDLLVKVGTDGKVSEVVLPEGTLPWMDAAAECLRQRLDFFPARLGTRAVESWTIVPARFHLARDGGEHVRLDPPALRSGEEAILEAYRACYPAGRTDEARIGYRITVNAGGRVKKAELVAPSGDAALDAAGICILKRLSFTPARRNGVNVEATVGWPILVRPPA
ncbi:MAG TPA: TonB family protein [Steroidobacteraceae bacterium]|nr:TonB family protein [Steroidobacteraceae bacterium]